MAARLQRLLSSFAPLLLTMTTGCTNSLDLGRFHHDLQGTSPGAVTFADLKFVAKAMRSHLNEYLELRIVDRTNSLQAKAVYQGVTSEDFSLYLAKIVPKMNGPYRIDFWADHNSSGKYDGIEGGINRKITHGDGCSAIPFLKTSSWSTVDMSSLFSTTRCSSTSPPTSKAIRLAWPRPCSPSK